MELKIVVKILICLFWDQDIIWIKIKEIIY